METFNRLVEIFESINPNCDAEVTLDSDIMEDLGFNSIAVFYMVLAIEKEFDVVLHNVSIEKFKTVRDVVEYIEAN